VSDELQREPQVDEKNVHYQGVIIGVPTFGKISDTFWQSDKSMGIPIFCNVGLMTIRGKPVDIARNEIAWICLQNKVGFIFFRDDDTICPSDALIKMMERFSHKEKSDPFNNASMLVGGIVYSKCQPPVPMVHIEGYTAGFEDWNLGDLIDCDCIGMGCTLIPVGLFQKLLPHITEYRCNNDLCPEPWGEFDKDKHTNCPHCNNPLIPGFFKTLRDLNKLGDMDRPVVTTEDSYFCMLVKKHVGAKVYADAGVICEHEVFHPSLRHTVYYGNYQNVGPGWRILDQVFFYPDVTKEKQHETSFTNKMRNGSKKDVKFNVGSGGCNIEGYISIDMTTECDFKCDAKDLTPAVVQYGPPSEILASHLLEHIPRDQLIGTLRNWLKCLQPGGLINIDVPDGYWAMQEVLKNMENGSEQNEWGEMVLFGAQRYPGDEHRTILYEKKLKLLMAACKNQVERYTMETIPAGTEMAKGMVSNQQCIRLKVWKKKGSKVTKATKGTKHVKKVTRRKPRMATRK